MPQITIRKNGKPLTSAERMRRHRASKKRALKAEREAARRARRIELTADLGIRKLAIADIAEADLASGQVDAVVTDPLYKKDALPLYGELGRLAMRVLKPGGWLVTLDGGLYLDRTLDLLRAPGLVYRDTISVVYRGGSRHAMRAPGRSAAAGWCSHCRSRHWGLRLIGGATTEVVEVIEDRRTCSSRGSSQRPR